MTKQEILNKFSGIMCNEPGICSLVTEQYGQDVLFERLINLSTSPLTRTQLNQILTMHQIPHMTKDVFQYYFFDNSPHFYKRTKLPEIVIKKAHIVSLDQFYIGIERLLIDSLFLFGNINNGYATISKYSYEDIIAMVKANTVQSDSYEERESLIELNDVNKDDRYLISEMACKTIGDGTIDEKELSLKLINEYRIALKRGKKHVKFKDLLAGIYSDANSKKKDSVGLFDTIDFYEEEVKEERIIEQKSIELARRYTEARRSAVANTRLYLATANDLDAYIATSMRTKEDFLKMSAFCDRVFKSERIFPLHMRYFDPTLSATSSHEDKGLIECLMVKQAKMLIYSSGEKDSYGKDAEAAMALCLGKPVIIFSPTPKRTGFFRNIHPLSRLVCFKNGVANGAIVCESEEQVIEMVFRIMNGVMEYELVQKEEKPGYYLLKERITGSVVRIQTNESYLNSVFWENYLA